VAACGADERQKITCCRNVRVSNSSSLSARATGAFDGASRKSSGVGRPATAPSPTNAMAFALARRDRRRAPNAGNSLSPRFQPFKGVAHFAAAPCWRRLPAPPALAASVGSAATAQTPHALPPLSTACTFLYAGQISERRQRRGASRSALDAMTLIVATLASHPVAGRREYRAAFLRLAWLRCAAPLATPARLYCRGTAYLRLAVAHRYAFMAGGLVAMRLRHAGDVGASATLLRWAGAELNV